MDAMKSLSVLLFPPGVLEGRQQPHLAIQMMLREQWTFHERKGPSIKEQQSIQSTKKTSTTTTPFGTTTLSVWHHHEHKTKCCFLGHGTAAPHRLGSGRTDSRWKLKAASTMTFFCSHFSQGGLGWQLEVERHL